MPNYNFEKPEKTIVKKYGWLLFFGTIINGIGVYNVVYAISINVLYDRFFLLCLMLIGYGIPGLVYSGFTYGLIPTELYRILLPKEGRKMSDGLYKSWVISNASIILLALLILPIGAIAGTFIFFWSRCNTTFQKWCHDDVILNPTKASSITTANNVIDMVNNAYSRTYFVQGILGIVMALSCLIYIYFLSTIKTKIKSRPRVQYKEIVQHAGNTPRRPQQKNLGPSSRAITVNEEEE